MEFDTVERCGRVYVSKNGVESTDFVEKSMGNWNIYNAAFYDVALSLEKATARIAFEMGDWYTATEAAARLVELGAFDKAPSAHDICMWARLGLLPGAVKVPGTKGGRGGSWRIPESALAEFMERRKE